MSTTDRSTFIPGGRTGFLLIHGLGGTPIELHFVAQGLAREGYTVYCCQLAGHGGSKEELQNSTWPEWYRSVEQAHDRLREHCDVVIAGGLSMGAILALHLAHERPDGVQGLALFAPTLRLDGWSMPWHSFILRWVRPTPLKIHMDLPEREPYGLKDERIRNFVVKSMLSGESGQPQFFTPLRAFAYFNSLVARVKRELSRIKAPALILHPRDDDMASIGNALEIQRKLGGMVEMVVLDDSYHIITLDRQRHIVVDKSIAFARGLERAIAARPGVKSLPVQGQRSRAE
jgi:carboxylesterase